MPDSEPPAPAAGGAAGPPSGARIAGRYEIVRPLGRGGFAHTFLARDLEHDRDVALKTLHSRSLTEFKAAELFEREAQVLLALRHQGVPQFVDYFRADVDGGPAAVLVMEFIDGVSLARMIAERRVLEPLQVLDLLIELLGILDYLHTRVPPILHRDVKPANVVVRPDGGPVLVDFGSVRHVFRAPGDSGSTVVGTYGYMPYEQYMGQASPASDLYALGATFLHLVTGRPPTEFLNDDGRIEVPASLPAGEPLRGVVARLLEPSPPRRYASARAAREALLAPMAPPRAGPGTTVVAAPQLQLGPAPRELTGDAAERFRRLAHSPWRLMDPTTHPAQRWGVSDVLSIAFFSLITAGVLPLVFVGIARARRRRLRAFFRDGVAGTATIVDFRQEDVGFSVKHTRVRYEFVAEGRTQRGSDMVLPVIADRWREGEPIEILYLPARDYDSIIISGA